MMWTVLNSACQYPEAQSLWACGDLQQTVVLLSIVSLGWVSILLYQYRREA